MDKSIKKDGIDKSVKERSKIDKSVKERMELIKV